MRDLSPADYEAALLKNGVPEFVAKILVNSDVSASAGWLFDDGRTLERLTGHRPLSLEDVLRPALKGA